MARAGVTYYEVADTADALKAQGLNPTVDRVSSVLGTGSRTTINNHLRAWKAQLNADRHQRMMKESLGSVLSQKAADIYEALETEAAQQFESTIKLQQEEIEKLKAQITDAANENGTLLESLDNSLARNKELEFQLANARARTVELEQVLQDCRMSLAEANTRVSDLRSHIASLKETEADLMAKIDSNTSQLANLAIGLSHSSQRQDQFASDVIRNFDDIQHRFAAGIHLLATLNENHEKQKMEALHSRPFARSFKRSPTKGKRI